MCLKSKKHKNSSAIDVNKEQAEAARMGQVIRQQDGDLSASLMHFTGIKVSLSASKTVVTSSCFRRLVDKADKEL